MPASSNTKGFFTHDWTVEDCCINIYIIFKVGLNKITWGTETVSLCWSTKMLYNMSRIMTLLDHHTINFSWENITLREMMTLKHDYFETPITHHFSLFSYFFSSLSNYHWINVSNYTFTFWKYFQVHYLEHLKLKRQKKIGATFPCAKSVEIWWKPSSYIDE